MTDQSWTEYRYNSYELWHLLLVKSVIYICVYLYILKYTFICIYKKTSLSHTHPLLLYMAIPIPQEPGQYSVPDTALTPSLLCSGSTYQTAPKLCTRRVQSKMRSLVARRVQSSRSINYCSTGKTVGRSEGRGCSRGEETRTQSIVGIYQRPIKRVVTQSIVGVH